MAPTTFNKVTGSTDDALSVGDSDFSAAAVGPSGGDDQLGLASALSTDGPTAVVPLAIEAGHAEPERELNRWEKSARTRRLNKEKKMQAESEAKKLAAASADANATQEPPSGRSSRQRIASQRLAESVSTAPNRENAVTRVLLRLVPKKAKSPSPTSPSLEAAGGGTANSVFPSPEPAAQAAELAASKSTELVAPVAKFASLTPIEPAAPPTGLAASTSIELTEPPAEFAVPPNKNKDASPTPSTKLVATVTDFAALTSIEPAGPPAKFAVPTDTNDDTCPSPKPGPTILVKPAALEPALKGPIEPVAPSTTLVAPTTTELKPRPKKLIEPADKHAIKESTKATEPIAPHDAGSPPPPGKPDALLIRPNAQEEHGDSSSPNKRRPKPGPLSAEDDADFCAHVKDFQEWIMAFSLRTGKSLPYLWNRTGAMTQEARDVSLWNLWHHKWALLNERGPDETPAQFSKRRSEEYKAAKRGKSEEELEDMRRELIDWAEDYEKEVADEIIDKGELFKVMRRACGDFEALGRPLYTHYRVAAFGFVICLDSTDAGGVASNACWANVDDLRYFLQKRDVHIRNLGADVCNVLGVKRLHETEKHDWSERALSQLTGQSKKRDALRDALKELLYILKGEDAPKTADYVNFEQYVFTEKKCLYNWPVGVAVPSVARDKYLKEQMQTLTRELFRAFRVMESGKEDETIIKFQDLSDEQLKLQTENRAEWYKVPIWKMSDGSVLLRVEDFIPPNKGKKLKALREEALRARNAKAPNDDGKARAFKAASNDDDGESSEEGSQQADTKRPKEYVEVSNDDMSDVDSASGAHVKSSNACDPGQRRAVPGDDDAGVAPPKTTRNKANAASKKDGVDHDAAPKATLKRAAAGDDKKAHRAKRRKAAAPLMVNDGDKVAGPSRKKRRNPLGGGGGGDGTDSDNSEADIHSTINPQSALVLPPRNNMLRLPMDAAKFHTASAVIAGSSSFNSSSHGANIPSWDMPMSNMAAGGQIFGGSQPCGDGGNVGGSGSQQAIHGPSYGGSTMFPGIQQQFVGGPTFVGAQPFVGALGFASQQFPGTQQYPGSQYPGSQFPGTQRDAWE